MTRLLHSSADAPLRRVMQVDTSACIASLLIRMAYSQVKALEAAEAARRKDAVRAADRGKQKDAIEQQKADRAKHALEVKVRAALQSCASAGGDHVAVGLYGTSIDSRACSSLEL